MDSNQQHNEALATTGFWGHAGAGTMIFARSTKRFLVPKRSQQCLEPGTWGVWSGAIDIGESPELAVMRECREECGYVGEYQLVKIYEYRSGTFVFHNFLTIIDEEFEPVLNWETEEARWLHLSEFPQPMHYGLQALLADPHSKAVLGKLVSE